MIEAKAVEYIENPAASTVPIDDQLALFGIPYDHTEERGYRIPKQRSHNEEVMTNIEWVSQAVCTKWTRPIWPGVV